MGAIGVAWSVSGSAPGLQVWVTNMDPSWNGVCTADSCEIPGPPDGDSSVTMTAQLDFSNMEKDNWGSSGTNYVFDPSAILALQFKLPAVTSGGLSYSFCIDRLGIIL